MNEYALNAAAEFQVRGDVAQAIDQSNQAAKYEALEYALTRERIQRENAERTIAGLRNVRSNISRSGYADVPGKSVATALFSSMYGEQQGRELVEEMSAGVSKGSPRQTRIRNFTITVEHVAADSFRYSLSSPRVHRDELKTILADAIKSVRSQVSPEAPLPSPEGIISNAPHTRVQEAHTERRATSMATAFENSQETDDISSRDQSEAATKTSRRLLSFSDGDRPSYDDLTLEEQRHVDFEMQEEMEAFLGGPHERLWERFQQEEEERNDIRSMDLRTPAEQVLLLQAQEARWHSLQLASGLYPNLAPSIPSSQISPEAPLPSPEGIIPNATEQSVQEPHAESRAKSMATATVTNPVNTPSSKQSKAVSTPKVARATKAPAKNKAAAAKEVEPIQQAQPVAEVAPEVTTPSVEPTAPAASEVAQEPTADQHWTKWRGAPENLPASMASQAKADYEKWAEKKPQEAAKNTLSMYVDYRIKKSIEAEKAAENVVEKAAVASGGPSEKHWTRQKGGYAALSDTQKEQALADFQKYAGTDQKKLAVGVEGYSNNRMAVVAKDIAMGTKMLIAKSNIQQGKAVDLSDSLVAHHFLEHAHNGGRGGNDALGRLRTTVDRSEAKTITLQNAYTLTVERNAKDTTVRTTLRAIPGREKDLMDKLDIAATASFNKAGRDRSKDHSQSRSTAELGR